MIDGAINSNLRRIRWLDLMEITWLFKASWSILFCRMAQDSLYMIM